MLHSARHGPAASACRARGSHREFRVRSLPALSPSVAASNRRGPQCAARQLARPLHAAPVPPPQVHQPADQAELRRGVARLGARREIAELQVRVASERCLESVSCVPCGMPAAHAQHQLHLRQGPRTGVCDLWRLTVQAHHVDASPACHTSLVADSGRAGRSVSSVYVGWLRGVNAKLHVHVHVNMYMHMYM